MRANYFTSLRQENRQDLNPSKLDKYALHCNAKYLKYLNKYNLLQKTNNHKKRLTDNRQKYVLTDARQQLIEPLFGEKRVLQTSEVQFENASHRIDVMIILIVCQRVIS